MSLTPRYSPATVQLVRVSALATGVFLGAMLLIALALVSFWKSLDPAAFEAWFVTHAFRLGRVMVPMGAAAFLTTTAALAVCRGEAPELKRALRIATAGLLGVIITYLGFVHPINLQFAAATNTGVDISALLSRWEFWHWVRVALGAVAFVALVRATELQGRAEAQTPAVSSAPLAA